MFTEYVWNKTKLGFTIRATRFNYNNINCMSEKSCSFGKIYVFFTERFF